MSVDNEVKDQSFYEKCEAVVLFLHGTAFTDYAEPHMWVEFKHIQSG